MSHLLLEEISLAHVTIRHEDEVTRASALKEIEMPVLLEFSSSSKAACISLKKNQDIEW